MASITVPAEFFRGELRVYGNWREAFARELLQNSADASPTRIDIDVHSADGHGVVTFTDDGHGMTRSVLEDVFFALGRTTKTGDGVVGGFGRARIITCFAQTRYTIRTKNLLVEGEGGTYTITETPDHIKGTVFTITLLDEDHERVERAFISLLSQCSLAVPVTLNGTQVAQTTLPRRAARVLRDSQAREWAKVYTSPGYGTLQVRVRGLVMFERYVYGNDNVYLELTPSRSREVLSASRDTLHTEFSTQLDQFVTALSQNRRQALRTPDAPLDVHVGGGGFILTDAARAADLSADTDPHGDPAGGPGALSQVPDSADPAPTQTVRVTAGNEAARYNLAAATAGSRAARPLPGPGSALGFDVFLMADSADARVRKLARTWDPTGWDATTGKRRRQLLLAWKAACGIAVDQLLLQMPNLGRVMWTVGWTFDTDALAVHRTVGDGHVLALNPVTETGTTRYLVSRRTDRRNLLASAIHEAAHIVADSHNEDFAALLTALYARIDQSDADRELRAAIAAG